MNYKSFFILGFPVNYLKFYLENIEQIYQKRQCYFTFKSKFKLIEKNMLILTAKLIHLMVICTLSMSPIVRVINYDVMLFLNCPSKINFIQVGCLMQCLYMYYIMYNHNYSKNYSVFSLILIKNVLYESNCRFFLHSKLGPKSSESVVQLIQKYINMFLKIFRYVFLIVGQL